MLVGSVRQAEAAEEVDHLGGHASAGCVLPDLAAWCLALDQLAAIIMRHSACAVHLHHQVH